MFLEVYFGLYWYNDEVVIEKGLIEFKEVFSCLIMYGEVYLVIFKMLVSL